MVGEKQEDHPPWQQGGKKCVHAKGGVCEVHGDGARYTWKPTFTKKITVVKGKEYCDISQNHRKLTQTKISFLKTTSSLKTTLSVKDKIPDTTINNDTIQKGERFSDININTTPSEGTTTTLCGDKGEHNGETGDEKWWYFCSRWKGLALPRKHVNFYHHNFP